LHDDAALGGHYLEDVPQSVHKESSLLLSNALPQYSLLFFLLIGTAATPGLLCQPWVIVKMIVERQMECRLAGETEVLGENLPQHHFCPSQNPT
jgi:hypothetical protein